MNANYLGFGKLSKYVYKPACGEGGGRGGGG